MDLSTGSHMAIVVLLTGIAKSALAGALDVFSVPLLMLKIEAAEAIALQIFRLLSLITD
jgi:uncharacterized protein